MGWCVCPGGSIPQGLDLSRTCKFSNTGTNTDILRHDPLRGQCQAGSLTGAVHLSKGNGGVLRLAQRGQKPRVEQKGKCWLDSDFQYEYERRKPGLSILLLSN